MEGVNRMKEYMKLKDEYLAKGWTSRSNINPDCVKAIKRWNKESGKKIAEAINNVDCKAIIREMSNASGRNEEIRKLSQFHDKIIYDAEGKAIYWWDYKERKVYQLES
jgi:hypothetical protein